MKKNQEASPGDRDKMSGVEAAFYSKNPGLKDD